jgi:DNA polymerase-3 subunit epsilon
VKYAAVDFETANSSRDSACALGIALIDDGQITARGYWLIQPPTLEFHAMNMAIHGITPEMVADKPQFPELWPEISDAVGDRILLAYHAAFDMNVFRDLFGRYELRPQPRDFLCTRVLSRAVWPGWASYSLPLVIEKLGLNLENHHDPEEDAVACAQIAMRAFAEAGTDDPPALAEKYGVRMGQLSAEEYASFGIQVRHTYRPSPSRSADGGDFDPDHALYGRGVVFTGTLGVMTRGAAMQQVVNLGGFCPSSVTKKVDYLVIGGQGFRNFVSGHKSSKIKRAETLAANGNPIEIIDEGDFLELLAD